jgi:hypothetical protein
MNSRKIIFSVVLLAVTAINCKSCLPAQRTVVGIHTSVTLSSSPFLISSGNTSSISATVAEVTEWSDGTYTRKPVQGASVIFAVTPLSSCGALSSDPVPLTNQAGVTTTKFKGQNNSSQICHADISGTSGSGSGATGVNVKSQ